MEPELELWLHNIGNFADFVKHEQCRHMAPATAAIICKMLQNLQHF
jgi:hypothetical protein